MSTVAFQSVSPIVTVQDLAQALAFYQHALGFAIAWTWGEPARLAAVCRDKVEITLAQADAHTGPAGSAHLYIRITDIDTYHARLVHAGVRITVPIDDRSYGLRDFRIADPSGNQLDFGQVLIDDGHA